MHSRARRAALLGADLVDPLRWVSRLRLEAPQATLISVYRRNNAERLETLVQQLPGMPVRLWALDKRAPSLERLSHGEGPGGRFQLLNRLAAEVPEDRWLLVCDDDVEFRPRGALTFLALAARLRLDLAQPAHANRGSQFYHRITGRRPFRLGRETTFVEIGPVLAVSPTARRRVIPFPEEGMGWGTELLWYDLQREGLRLGIVDATPIRHLGVVAAGYDATAEDQRQRRKFDERGMTDWQEIQRNVRSRWL